MAVVGVVTIEGKEYRLHYGMTLAEQFSGLVVDSNGGKVKLKKPSTQQILKCIIYHGHENWCENNDEPFDLKMGQVSVFIEEAYANSDQKVLEQFNTISKDFMASRFIDDLLKAGKELESDKKKLIGTELSEPPLKSDLNPGSTES